MHNKRILIAGVCLSVAVLAATSRAHAIGPVDAEVGLAYWNAETEATGSTSENAAAPAGFGNVWLKNALGFGVSRYEASPEGTLQGADSDFTAVDAKWRFLNATRNNFVAVGLGAEKVGIVDDSTTAARIVVEGRVSIKMVYVYGKGAYLPSLGDMTISGVTYDGKTGTELEAGVAVHPIPLLSVYAAYKSNSIDLTSPIFGDVSLDNKGPVAGMIFSF